MTDADINQLRDLLRAATPGPLTVMARNHGEQCVAVVNKLELVPPNSVELAHELDDADLLAAAVNALPSLLGEVERLRCRNEVLWNALWKVSGDHEPHVAANLESVGGNPADFLDDDMNGEHDDRQ